MSALTRLADAVEAGTATDFQFYTFRDGLSGTVAETKTMIRAYNGSLDAAKALHEAVLPWWDWSVDNIGRSQFCAVVYDGAKTISAFNHNPARALLLAIIRALAQVQG
jgi:hypothetical protein